MKRKYKKLVITIVIATMIITGCTTSTSTTATTTSTTSSTGTVVADSSGIAVDKEFSANDLEVGYEDSTATHIVLSSSSIKVTGSGAKAEDSVLTISEEGTYVMTGTLKNGQIVVDAKDTAKIRIVLNGVDITCSDNAAIYVKSADKVWLTLADKTENSLTDGSTYKQSDDNTVDGVIFSMSDLTLNGTGALTVTGNYNHGIVSKDDLIITGGIYNISAIKDGLNGKDCVKIKEGTFNISVTDGNGIQSKNGDETTKGYVYICGGDINITQCMEGIEGTAIIIEDGKIAIVAKDDGFNAASGKTSTTTDTTASDSSFGGGKDNGAMQNDTNCYISISGGTINVNASGDGIDSNGSLFISGGTIYVSGPTDNGNGGLDYNGTAEVTGGTIVVAGSSGMAQGFGDTSTQYSLLYNLTEVCEAGVELQLTDSNGTVIASFTPDKQYQSVVVSTPNLTNGIYTLTCGSQTNEVTLSSVVTSVGEQATMGGGGQGGPSGKGGMQRPNDTGDATN